MKKLFYLLFCVFVSVSVSFSVFADPYSHALKKWTRSDEIYRPEDLHAAIVWKATLLNDAMRAAQASKYAALYQNPAEKSNRLADLDKKGRGGALFFVSFYSPLNRDKDLSNPKGNWKLRLEAEGRFFEPIMIEKVSKKDSLSATLYPYWDIWFDGYYVAFPAHASFLPSPWHLALFGPQGHSRLTWK